MVEGDHWTGSSLHSLVNFSFTAVLKYQPVGRFYLLLILASGIKCDVEISVFAVGGCQPNKSLSHMHPCGGVDPRRCFWVVGAVEGRREERPHL